MASQALARHNMGQVVEVQFGRRGVSRFRPGATDPGRRMRLQALEGLAPTLVHELAQPLAATTNYLDAAIAQLRGKIGGHEDVIRTMEQAKAQARRAGEIIRSMRNFALNGEVNGHLEDLRGIVGEALALVPGIQGVDISFAYHASAVYAIIDRVQFRQVLTNLFTNAVEAMADSPAKQLRIVTREAAGDGTLIRIEDSGPGLNAEVFGRLYEPFVTTKSYGTGLGLPICNAIVEAHGGQLWASQPKAGHGAAFNIVLPARAKGGAL